MKTVIDRRHHRGGISEIYFIRTCTVLLRINEYKIFSQAFLCMVRASHRTKLGWIRTFLSALGEKNLQIFDVFSTLKTTILEHGPTENPVPNGLEMSESTSISSCGQLLSYIGMPQKRSWIRRFSRKRCRYEFGYPPPMVTSINNRLHMSHNLRRRNEFVTPLASR